MLTLKNGVSVAAFVSVSNALTGESVVWTNSLAAGAWLRLSSATQRCEVSTDDGETWVRRNENVTGLIPQIKGGVANEITISGLTGATYEFEYTAKG